MNGKKWMMCVAVSLVAILPLFAGPANNSKKKSAQNETQQNMQSAPSTQPSAPSTQQPMTQPMMQPKTVDCTKLSAQEQDFANQLNPTNKMLFCSKFNPDMRKNAMNSAGLMGSDGTLVTNDQAVEQVAKSNNMMPTMAPAARSAGSCPAK